MPILKLTPYAALHARIMSRQVVIVCGGISMALGALSIAGYLFGIPGLYQWEAAVGMAPNTAIAVFLSGLGIAILGNSDSVWRCDAGNG